MTRKIDVPSLGSPVAATDDSFFLAEGPIWDSRRQRLLWVDIMAGAVHEGRLRSDGTIELLETVKFPDTAGAVATTRHGEMIVAGTHRLYRRDTAGVIHDGPTLVEGAHRRLNDGKVDPFGSFVVGTKGPGGETLIRVGPDGSTETIDDDLTLSNGIAWSTDGYFYNVDTLSRRIFVRSWTRPGTAMGTRQVFLDFENLPAFDGSYPDGITVDAENYLWVAMWGGGAVARLAPDGSLVGLLNVPAPHVSSVTFAGESLDTLVITTATEGLSEEALSLHPQSGRLFTVRVGVVGREPFFWESSTNAHRKDMP